MNAHRGRYTAHVLAPILALLMVCIAGTATLFYWLTYSQNEIALEREHKLVAAAMGEQVGALRSRLSDYGIWDDVYANMVVTLNKPWADTHLGPYLFRTHGFDYSFVLDGRDRTIYSSSGDQRTSQPALTSLGPAFARAVAEIRLAGPRSDLRLAGLTRINGRVSTFGVTRIKPSPGRNADPNHDDRLLVLVEHLDEGVLRRMVNRAHVGALHLTHSRSANHENHELVTYDGRIAGYLAWTPGTPGTDARRTVAPWILAFSIVIILLAAFALRHARHAAQELLMSRGNAADQARLDALTELPNRRAFLEHLGSSPIKTGAVGLLYLDLDGFKDVNDLFGHTVGDKVLKAAASRLASVVSWRGLLARVGGDEFAIVISGANAHESVEVLATAINHAFEAAFETAGHNIRVGTSIGISLGSGEIEPDELVRRADVAMYAAKAAGKRRARLYDSSMDVGRDIKKQLECELREAIETDQIRVLYQPIIDAQSGAITMVEALARWNSSTRGDIPPDVFVPIAETSGLIGEFGKKVLRTACAQARSWDLDLAVNLSPAQFWDEGLFDDITEILEETHFPANRLELEITEGYLLRRPEAAAIVLERLRELGIRVALDDFGTGYASVGYLKRFKLDRLKLDKSFSVRIAEDPQAATLAAAVIALGQALGLAITAEGVETEDQARVLRAAGCKHLQGWLFGRPATGFPSPASAPRREAA